MRDALVTGTKIIIVSFFSFSLVDIILKRIPQPICKLFLLNTDNGLLFGVVFSNYETTLAFLCTKIKTLSALVTGSRSLTNNNIFK